MNDLETTIQLSVYRHVAGECIQDTLCDNENCACLDEARSLGSQIYNDVAPTLSATKKIVNWILVLTAITCAWIVYSEPGSVPLKILAALGVLASFCQIAHELLTGRNTP